jgi:hypothetical protein
MKWYSHNVELLESLKCLTMVDGWDGSASYSCGAEFETIYQNRLRLETLFVTR